MPPTGQYARAFRKPNRGNAPGTKKKAPHKPVLLLAVLDKLKAGSITEHRVYSRHINGTGRAASLARPVAV